MYQALKSMVKSNAVTDLLKDPSLSKAYHNFRGVNAEQSSLSSVDKMFRHHSDSKAFNEAMAEKSSSLSESITKAGANSVRGQRLAAQQKAYAGNSGLSEAEFASRRKAAVEDNGRTRRSETAAALKKPSADLRGAIKNYYTDGTGTQKAARIGATAGAFGVAAVGTRYMTGGSATVNNRGQRDIAGIPFV